MHAVLYILFLDSYAVSGVEPGGHMKRVRAKTRSNLNDGRYLLPSPAYAEMSSSRLLLVVGRVLAEEVTLSP
jgi:hypothetical protein